MGLGQSSAAAPPTDAAGHSVRPATDNGSDLAPAGAGTALASGQRGNGSNDAINTGAVATCLVQASSLRGAASHVVSRAGPRKRRRASTPVSPALEAAAVVASAARVPGVSGEGDKPSPATRSPALARNRKRARNAYLWDQQRGGRAADAPRRHRSPMVPTRASAGTLTPTRYEVALAKFERRPRSASVTTPGAGVTRTPIAQRHTDAPASTPPRMLSPGSASHTPSRDAGSHSRNRRNGRSPMRTPGGDSEGRAGRAVASAPDAGVGAGSSSAAAAGSGRVVQDISIKSAKSASSATSGTSMRTSDSCGDGAAVTAITSPASKGQLRRALRQRQRYYKTLAAHVRRLNRLECILSATALHMINPVDVAPAVAFPEPITVYRATVHGSHDECVVKVVGKDWAADAEVAAHTSLLAVPGSRVVPLERPPVTLSCGRRALFMRFLQPGFGDPTDARTFLRLTADLFEALAAWHRAGWVHCDIKPTNMGVDMAGELFVFDLGLAMQLKGPEFYPVRMGGPVGTAGFMAPEVADDAAGNPYGTPADVYSACECVLELIKEADCWRRGSSGAAQVGGVIDGQSDTATVLKRLRKLMRKGKAADPTARPTAVAVANTVQKLRLELSGAHESHHEDEPSLSRAQGRNVLPAKKGWW